MNKETLYDLRSIVALHPYYQPARMLMLKNLYLLHDSSFDEELRRAAIYITDRRVIFDLVEAGHYQLAKQPAGNQKPESVTPPADRSMALIDNFLDSLPKDEQPAGKRKPTPADATVDYVAYLLETESEEEQKRDPQTQMKGQSLIDDFIDNKGGKIELKEQPEFLPEIAEENDSNAENEGYFTETLARIYIRQGRYSAALEIIKRLNLNYPKKNAYFADQIRFLEKLIINSKNK